MKIILLFIIALLLTSCATQSDSTLFEKRLKVYDGVSKWRIAESPEKVPDLWIKEINDKKSFNPEDYYLLSKIYFSRKDYNMSLMNINKAISLTEGSLKIVKAIDASPPWQITDIMADVMVSIYGIMLNKSVDSDMVDEVGEKIDDYLRDKRREYINVVDARWNLKDSLPELYYQRALIYVCLKEYRKAEKDFLFCYDKGELHSEYQKALWEFRRAYFNESTFRKDDLSKEALQEADEFKKNRMRDRRIDILFRFFPYCYPTKSRMTTDYDKPYFTMTEEDVIDLIGPPDYVRYRYREGTGIYKDEQEFIYDLDTQGKETFTVTFFKGKVVSAH